MKHDGDENEGRRAIEVKRVRSGIRAGQGSIEIIRVRTGIRAGECSTGLCGSPEQSGGGGCGCGGGSVLLANTDAGMRHGD